jgi:hypothetical protein
VIDPASAGFQVIRTLTREGAASRGDWERIAECDGLFDPRPGLLRDLALPADPEQAELMGDADELEGFAVQQRVLDPDAQALHSVAPAFRNIRIAEREVWLVAHDLEQPRMRRHELEPPVHGVRHHDSSSMPSDFGSTSVKESDARS